MNHERAILSDFEDRGRGHELRCAGSVNTGVAGAGVSRSDQLPWTWPREAHASLPPGLQDKASAVLKPWLSAYSSLINSSGSGKALQVGYP